MNRQRGLVKLVIVIVIGLIVLGYFGLDLKEILQKPVVHNNLVYVWNFIVIVWNRFIEAPATWIWREIFIEIIWYKLLLPLITKAKA
ncbi:MAG TPA: hypothetical protein VI981_03425 [Candidatus Paceibacterota bacterium]